MQLDYIDLMLLHSPGDPDLRPETWRALEDLHRQVQADRKACLGLTCIFQGVEGSTHLVFADCDCDESLIHLSNWPHT